MRHAAFLSATTSLVPAAVAVAAAVVLGALLARCDSPVRATPDRPGALDRTDLPQVVRGLLRHRMERHGRTMTELLHASLTLDHPRIVQLSDQLAAEPRIARLSAGAATDVDLINRYLPARFFELQDQLLHDARALARAAGESDDDGVAQAYGHMATTCIQCHATYLRAPHPPTGTAAPPHRRR